ncbi:MAG: RDD family protein [Acidobacteriaceae bacterium]|nr:RDD family protein [Acidobacteriaceae bacterium]MBV8573046.1 RDD family protein [Acidobacteriaceae bacterium]
MRLTPSRVSPETYPIAATATAPAYDFEEDPEKAEAPVAQTAQSGQQTLFSAPALDPRVIPFDSLTSPAEREAIRTRAADFLRPAPLRHGKVEVKRAKSKRAQSADQRRLEFLGQQEVLSPPQTHIICDALVAPVMLRAQAALVDLLLIACGCVFGFAFFLFEGGALQADKHVLPFFAAAVMTVAVSYKLLWAFAGRDSIGMQAMRLRLVDFDGNPPGRERRYVRQFSSFVSFLAAGVGLIWSLVDEDALTWHDHMSSTFPTISSEQ